MKKEKISKALGDIHTKFVEEAAEYRGYGENAWRKWGTVAASFVAVFICLSILGVGFGTNGFFTRREQEKEKVTFTVSIPSESFQGLIQSAWDNFEQQTPELQDKEVTLKFVDYEGATSYFQQEGNAADLILTDDYYLWELFAEDQLVNLNLFGATQYKDRFSESVWELGTADDVLYGLPFSAGTVLYSGRKDVMDAAGVALPQTWKEMLTVGSTLKQAGQTHIFYEQCYSPRHSMGGDTNLLLSWIWRLGGDVINEDGTATAINENDALSKTLTMFQELQKQNLLVEDGSDESVFTQMYGFFVQYYLQNEGNQHVYGLMPQLEEGIPGYSVKYGYCVGIPKISKQQSLAYAFLEHLMFGTDNTTGKSYQIMAFEEYEEGIPALTSLLAETGFSEDLLEIYTQQLSISKVVPRTKAFPYCTEILAGTIAEVLENGRDPSEVAAEVEQELNQLLEAYLQNEESTMPPTGEPTPTPNPETMLKQGWLKDYELLHYEEQKGELYDYATFVFRLGHRGGILFRKAVAIFEKEDATLKEMVYIDPEDSFTLSNLGDNYIPVKEMDVNFDGKKDILIFKGTYGKNGYEKYACYLGTDDGITYCPSFEEICDPAISIDKKIIQGAWRNNIASRTGLAYQFIDGEFVNVEMLTWTERQDEKENDYNEWVLERLVNGKFSVVENFSDKGMSEAEKEDLQKQLESFGSYAPIRYYESDRYYQYLLNEAKKDAFSTYQVDKYVVEKGTVYDYAVLLLRPQDSNENYIKLVAVIDQGNIVDTFSVEIDGPLSNGKNISEVDVNFDGEMDVLVFRGIFGNACYAKYTCYLGTKEGKFVYCPSFDEILNPEVDTEKKFIRSWSQDTASTHYGYIYQFMDGAFIKTEELKMTFGGVDKYGEEVSIWTVKQYIDGKMVVVETLVEEEWEPEDREIKRNALKKYDVYYSWFISPSPEPDSNHGLFKDFKLLTYEEQKGEFYDYATLILLGETNGDNRFMKIVAVFRDELLIDILYGKPEDAYRFDDIEGNLIPVWETDVNFDGKTDLLIYRGSFSAAGYEMYDCYFGTITGILGTVTKFEYCPSFEGITDPVVDTEKQIIQSVWRNHAGSRTGVVYQFIEGAFVDVEHLTWTSRDDENGNEYNEWVLERRINGELSVIEIFSEEGMTQTEKLALRKQLESLDSYAPIGYYEE